MKDRITVNTKMHFGKPCAVGARITVHTVLELLNAGPFLDEMTQDHTALIVLAAQDTRASIEYALLPSQTGWLHMRCHIRPLHNVLELTGPPLNRSPTAHSISPTRAPILSGEKTSRLIVSRVLTLSRYRWSLPSMRIFTRPAPFSLPK